MPKHSAASAVFDDGSIVFTAQQRSYFQVFFFGSHTKRLAHSPKNKRTVNFLVNSYSVIPSLTGNPADYYDALDSRFRGNDRKGKKDIFRNSKIFPIFS